MLTKILFYFYKASTQSKLTSLMYVWITRKQIHTLWGARLNGIIDAKIDAEKNAESTQIETSSSAYLKKIHHWIEIKKNDVDITYNPELRNLESISKNAETDVIFITKRLEYLKDEKLKAENELQETRDQFKNYHRESSFIYWHKPAYFGLVLVIVIFESLVASKVLVLLGFNNIGAFFLGISPALVLSAFAHLTGISLAIAFPLYGSGQGIKNADNANIDARQDSTKNKIVSFFDNISDVLDHSFIGRFRKIFLGCLFTGLCGICAMGWINAVSHVRRGDIEKSKIVERILGENLPPEIYQNIDNFFWWIQIGFYVAACILSTLSQQSLTKAFCQRLSIIKRNEKKIRRTENAKLIANKRLNIAEINYRIKLEQIESFKKNQENKFEMFKAAYFQEYDRNKTPNKNKPKEVSPNQNGYHPNEKQDERAKSDVV